MVTKNKAGKAVLSVPQAGSALAPWRLNEGLLDAGWVASGTDQGRLLLFRLEELPELNRGKGNKLINIPTAAFKAGEEKMIATVALTNDQELLVHAGQRYLRLKHKDLENYIGERARRGRKLPRGFQKVVGLTVEG